MINLKKLLTESADPKQKIQESSDLVRGGLEKVFSNSTGNIPYRRLENVGLGYIKSVSEAIKVALQESRKVAKTYGYRDDETNEVFIKENDFSAMSAENPSHRDAMKTTGELPHGEMDSSNGEEQQEVKIGNQIIGLTKIVQEKLERHSLGQDGMDIIASVGHIELLAKKLIEMHGAK